MGVELELAGKAAVVTGAAVGIGEAIALRLAEAGAAVAVVDRDIERAELVAAAIRKGGGRAEAIRADVSKLETGKAAIERAVQAFGRLDVLVNNAGIFPMTPALDVTEELWDRVVDVNLKGAFFLAQAAAKAMIAGGNGGAVVNIASIDAEHPSGFLSTYDASKGGLLMLTRSLALEWAAHGIRVNAIEPGAIDTPGARATMPAGAAAEKIAAMFATRIPLKRSGTPREIADATLFLASGAASYVTGSVLRVDGGFLLT